MVGWVEASQKLDCKAYILLEALIIEGHGIAIIIDVGTVSQSNAPPQIGEKCTHWE